MSELPVLIETVMGAVDDVGHLFIRSGLCSSVNNIGNMRRAVLAGEERHAGVALQKLRAVLIFVTMDALRIAALFPEQALTRVRGC